MERNQWVLQQQQQQQQQPATVKVLVVQVLGANRRLARS
jgi:hypothetical protein